MDYMRVWECPKYEGEIKCPNCKSIFGYEFEKKPKGEMAIVCPQCKKEYKIGFRFTNGRYCY